MRCPECTGEVSVDFTIEFDRDKPFELVCFACGWFDPQRYASREEAELAIETV